MKTKSLIIRTKSIYGRVLYYPACPDSETLARLTGKKTLSAGDLREIQSLGFEIKYKSEFETEEEK